MARLSKLDWRSFHRNPFTAEDDWVGRELRPIFPWIRIPFVVFVIEDDERATGVDKLEQPRICSDQFRVCFVAAIVDDDCLIGVRSPFWASSIVNSFALTPSAASDLASVSSKLGKEPHAQISRQLAHRYRPSDLTFGNYVCAAFPTRLKAKAARSLVSPAPRRRELARMKRHRIGLQGHFSGFKMAQARVCCRFQSAARFRLPIVRFPLNGASRWLTRCHLES